MADHMSKERRTSRRSDADTSGRRIGRRRTPPESVAARVAPLVQMRRSLDASPSVVQLTRLTAALHSAPVQLTAAPEEEELVQAKQAPNRTGLPDGLKAGVEALSGLDLSDVRVHRNSSGPAQLNALAYAQGSDIHVAPGQEQHLPHEAWHVVQQRQGRVAPTARLRGVDLNDDHSLEAEADRMGTRAAQTKLENS